MKFCLKPETPILYSAPQGFPRRLFYLKTALKRGQEKTQSETGIRRRTQRVLENHRLPVQNVVGTRSGPAAPGLHRDAGRPAGAGDGARAGDEPVPAPRGQAGAGQESMRTGNKHPSDKEAGVASPHARHGRLGTGCRVRPRSACGMFQIRRLHELAAPATQGHPAPRGSL